MASAMMVAPSKFTMSTKNIRRESRDVIRCRIPACGVAAARVNRVAAFVAKRPHKLVQYVRVGTRCQAAAAPSAVAPNEKYGGLGQV